jgi:hypothetical protein
LKRKTSNTPVPPLQPRSYSDAPTVITKPDLQVEEVLFQSYLRERQRAYRYLAEMLRLKADAKAKKAWARVQRLTKLKVSPSEKR